MANKANQVVLDALHRAVADPAGVPLYATKSVPGLFARSAAAKKAAELCKEQGYVKVLRSETQGKTAQEICAITEKGLAFLLEQLSPREVLESFVNALNARQAQLADLLASARQTQASIDALKSASERVLQQLNRPAVPVPSQPANGNGTSASAWLTAVLEQLGQWHASGTIEDCPLPALYRFARQTAANLSVGQFHDGLRSLHQREQIYLHPWTGPMYEIPEPTFALLVGHEIAYYASLRQ